jgi:hypothetical protein
MVDTRFKKIIFVVSVLTCYLLVVIFAISYYNKNVSEIKYQEITLGMSLDEVEEVFKKDGILFKSEENIFNSNVYEHYYWVLKDKVRIDYIIVIFENEKAIEKYRTLESLQ